MIDYSIYLAAAILVLDASSFDLGALVNGLVVVGGLSLVFIGLASKDPAIQLLQGALLMAVNKFRKNETIRLGGDGTEGLLEATLMSELSIEFAVVFCVCSVFFFW
jgi:small-conductance mechanosensitive channel